MRYNIGDTVWMQSNWFAGSYIPDCFKVAAVREHNGKYQYRKKRSRTWWDEGKLFPTEEECQKSEVKRFIIDTRKQASELVQNCRLLGLEQEAVKLLTADTKALPTAKDMSKKVFDVGDRVWGFTERIYGLPQELTITRVLKSTDGEKSWYSYNVKGHSSLIVDGDSLFPTREDACLASVEALKERTQSILNGLSERYKHLELPTNNLLINL